MTLKGSNQEILEEFLNLNKISVAKFSRICGLSRQTIYNYLSGKPARAKNEKKMTEACKKTLRKTLHFQKVNILNC